MRLGSYDCYLHKESIAFRAYESNLIQERHRHRYELNNEYKAILEKSGMKIAGSNKELDLAEIIEIKNHPWFVGVQFHPEYQSTFVKPHPLFVSFINAIYNM